MSLIFSGNIANMIPESPPEQNGTTHGGWQH